MDEELLKRVEEAASKGAKRGSRGNGFLPRLLPWALLIAVLLAMPLYIKYAINQGWNDFTEGLKNQMGFEAEADSHDLVLENNGIRGYTAADFAEAILGETSQLRKLEVYTAEVSDAVTLTDTGFANISFLSKSQIITYHGTATYTVDLSNLNENSIVFDETHKTIKLLIPHAHQEPINIPRERIEFGDTEKGWLAFGDIKSTSEEQAKVESKATSEMEKKLDELKEQENADKFAKMSVWELYQPMVSKVSPEYKLEIDFE